MAGQHYHLILTKPIGIGVILAAQMKAGAPGFAISAAIKTMSESNALPARLLLEGGAIGMTDVTGFGLAGHGSQLLAQNQFSGAILYLDDVPVIEGALALSQNGIALVIISLRIKLRNLLKLTMPALLIKRFFCD